MVRNCCCSSAAAPETAGWPARGGRRPDDLGGLVSHQSPLRPGRKVRFIQLVRAACPYRGSTPNACLDMLRSVPVSLVVGLFAEIEEAHQFLQIHRLRRHFLGRRRELLSAGVLLRGFGKAGSSRH